MLKITRVKKNDGSYEGEWSCSPEQLSFLLTYAVNTLVAKGLAEVEEKTEDDANGN